MAAFQRRITESNATAEPVLITTGDPLASQTFRHAMDQLSLPSLWIISVERDGRLSVMQRTRQGTSIRKKIHLPLDEILRTDAVLKNRRVADNLPAIFVLEDFPLLLSHQTRPGRVFKWEKQVVSISDDGRLMLWEEEGLGARQLCDDLPQSHKRIAHLIGRNAAAFEFLLPGGNPEIVRLTRPLAVRRVKIVEPIWNVADVRQYGSAVIAISDSGNHICYATALDRNDGRQIAVMSSITGTQRNGRCFYRNRKWDVLALTGSSLVWQKLPEEYQDAVDVMELESGHFVYVSNTGQLCGIQSSLGQIVSQSPGKLEGLMGYLPGANAIGLRIGNNAAVLDMKSGSVRSQRRPLPRGCEIPGTLDDRLLKTRGTHWRFRRISTEGVECLRLQGKSGQLFEIILHGDHIILRAHQPSKTMGSETIRFVPQRHDLLAMTVSEYGIAKTPIGSVAFDDCPGPANVGYLLKLAEFPNGNKAWLDSRGLLHLKNANATYPEITLTLRDGELSGWLSTGEVFGEDYYCGRKSEQRGLDRITPAAAWESAIKPFMEALPWSFHYSFDTATDNDIVWPES